jgi:hypothetical protein
MRAPFAFVLLFAAGCAATTASGPKLSAKDYYPLEAGTVWVYQAKYLGEARTRTVVMGPTQDGFHVDDQGGKFIYDGEGLRDESRYLLREPLREGQSWSSVAALGVTEKYTVIKAQAACKTTTLHFDDCIEVKGTLPAQNGASLENSMWFARGTGLVRMETVLVRGETRTKQVEMQLSEFKPVAK